MFSQDSDYTTVKGRVTRLCLTGQAAEGVATIDVAITALEVGEYLTPLMTKELSWGASAWKRRVVSRDTQDYN